MVGLKIWGRVWGLPFRGAVLRIYKLIFEFSTCLGLRFKIFGFTCLELRDV